MSHFIRTQLVSHLLDKLDLKRNDDVAKETHPSRIRKDHKQLMDISELLASCKNPFDLKECSAHLINLSSGKAASKETQSFLLNIRENGGNAMNDFILRCLRDPAEFERPIKRQKIITFAEDGAVVNRTAKEVIEETKMERDLIGKLLMISLKGKLDIGIYNKENA